ncbi:hypothetical protein EA848_25115, partial [Vibrio anguillarum]
IKQLLRLASDQSGREDAVGLVNRVTGVAFMGTPHTGADLAQKGNTLLGRVLLRSVTFLLLKPSAVTASLERNDPTLRELNTWYREWCHDKEIRHLVLVESKSLPILGRIVKPDSSDPGLQVRPTSI